VDSEVLRFQWQRLHTLGDLDGSMRTLESFGAFLRGPGHRADTGVLDSAEMFIRSAGAQLLEIAASPA
jgi:hypothetical protein